MSAMIFIGAIPSITNPKQTPSTLDDALFNIASTGSGGGGGGMGAESPLGPRESPKDYLGNLRNDWQKHVFQPKVLQLIHVLITVLITVNMFASLVLILGVKSVRGIIPHLKFQVCPAYMWALFISAQSSPPSALDHLDWNDSVPLPCVDRANTHSYPHRRSPHNCPILLGRALRRITLSGKELLT